jgi:hypothetical protein
MLKTKANARAYGRTQNGMKYRSLTTFDEVWKISSGNAIPSLLS